MFVGVVKTSLFRADTIMQVSWFRRVEDVSDSGTAGDCGDSVHYSKFNVV